MRCPYCGYRESKVVDSRPADEGSSIRRRRECLQCEKRFTTYETVESLPMVVIKKDGSRQSFDRSKVMRGIQRSCEKRPVAVADMERMASEIEQELQNSLEREVSTEAIGEKVSVKVVFPQEYHAKDLAGKDAEFRCVIHEIHEKGKYQMDEVFAKEVGQCDTMEQMRERMGRSMQYYSDEQAEMELQDSLLQQAAQTLEMEITDKQVEDAIEEQLQSMKAQLAQQGLSLEMYCQFMQTSEEKLRQEATPAARQSILTAATIEKIVELEGLKAEEEEICKACEHICKRNNITMDVLRSMEDENLDKMVERAVLTSKVMSLIRENAEITEE